MDDGAAILAAFRARYQREPRSDFERDYFATNGRIPVELPAPPPSGRPAPKPIPNGTRDPSDGSIHYPTFDEMFPTPLNRKPPATT